MSTVALLFTDIEGSTRLWEQHQAPMAVALACHDELLREAIEARGGRVFKTVGDAFCAAFDAPRAAVGAALDAQSALAAEPWPEQTPLRVRMAVHLGECEERDGDYFGPPLNRVARLLAIGHGGQVLTSGIVAGMLDGAATVRDLGEHRLRDLGQPERVFQADAKGTEREFPALRSLENPRLRHNLPEQLTALIGREREVGEIRALLGGSRLVTLIGAGGAGKTRLALQAAAELVDGSGDGVWLVELAPLAAPELVAPAVCAALGLREDAARAPADRLVGYLRERELLLVLDNCEHVIDACAALAGRILRECPQVVLLATSRQALGVDGEHAYRVPSLRVPGPDVAALDTILASDAVQLIRERARQHDSGFELDHTNAALCGAVCRQLDGMPLALELAAARLRSMSLADVHERLDQRFRLLTRGSRSALPRQQTLRATVDWSYELLDPDERELLRGLSVFAGGFELDSAEALGASRSIDPIDVADLLDALVDKSLVQIEHSGSGVRYGLLETVRQYAAEQLEQERADTVAAARGAHAEHFLALAERLDTRIVAEPDLPKLVRLGAEHENLRLALDTLLEAPDDAEPALRLVNALYWYLELRGLLVAGAQMFERALAHPAFAAATQTARARALLGTGTLAVFRGDADLALRMLEQAHAAALAVGDLSTAAIALRWTAYAHTVHGDRVAAARVADAAVELAIAAGDPHAEAQASSLTTVDGPAEAAIRLVETQRAVAIFEELADVRWSAVALNNLANLEVVIGDFDSARLHLEESMRRSLMLQNESNLAYTGTTLVLVCIQQGDLDAALAHVRDLSVRAERLGYGLTAYVLLDHALIATCRGRHELAATLHGAADAELARGGSEDFDIAEATVRDADREQLRAALGAGEFERLYRDGTRLGMRRALELTGDH